MMTWHPRIKRLTFPKLMPVKNEKGLSHLLAPNLLLSCTYTAVVDARIGSSAFLLERECYRVLEHVKMSEQAQVQPDVSQLPEVQTDIETSARYAFFSLVLCVNARFVFLSTTSSTYQASVCNNAQHL